MYLKTSPGQVAFGGRRVLTVLAAACAGALALGGMAGALSVAWVPPTLGAMGAPTALTFLVAIAGVAATAASRRRARLFAAATVCASAVLGLMLHTSTGFRQRESILLSVGALEIELLEVAPLTALSFLFLGGALAAAGRDAAELLIGVPAAVALLVATGHLFGSPELTSLGTATPMTIWSAVATMLIAAAMLATSPDTRWMRILTADSPAGFTARRLAFVAVVVPFALAWLRLLGQRRGLYGTEIGVSIYMVGVVAALLAVVFLTTSKRGGRSPAAPAGERAAGCGNEVSHAGRAVTGRHPRRRSEQHDPAREQRRRGAVRILARGTDRQRRGRSHSAGVSSPARVADGWLPECARDPPDGDRPQSGRSAQRRNPVRG